MNKDLDKKLSRGKTQEIVKEYLESLAYLKYYEDKDYVHYINGGGTGAFNVILRMKRDEPNTIYNLINPKDKKDIEPALDTIRDIFNKYLKA
jgi:hypothetical protein